MLTIPLCNDPTMSITDATRALIKLRLVLTFTLHLSRVLLKSYLLGTSSTITYRNLFTISQDNL